MSKHTLRSFSPLLLCTALSAGCASFAVPGRPADLSIFTKEGQLDPVREVDERPVESLGIGDLLARQPMAAFPTSMAVVRIQAPGYGADSTTQTAGSGPFTVVTSRTPEEETAFAELAELPMLSGVAPVNRLLVPEQLSGDLELREIAARLHADVLLVYTLDTSSRTAEPSPEQVLIGLLTLGGYLRQDTDLECTASAVLLDTRTGYLYGTAEASARRSKEHSCHGAEARVERERRRLERAALAELASELGGTWQGVVATYAPATPGAPRGTE